MCLRRLALALTLPFLVAGCSDDAPGEPEGSPSSTVASGEPTADQPDYPAEGVDLVDLPELAGVYQQGLQTYVDFERGRRLAAREGKVGRLLAFNATADVVDAYRAALRSSGPADGSYDGEVVVEFLDARPRDSVLRLEVCVDGTGLVVPETAPAVLGEATRALQQIEVTFIEGVWRVTRAEVADDSC